MKYGIIINPAAGNSNKDALKRILKQISDIIGPDCLVAGMDTQTSVEFCMCARDMSHKVDTLIVCGGDGSFLDVMNAFDCGITLSYISLGSGNALRYALKMPRSISAIAEQIKNGREHSMDVILCNDSKKALFASVGIDSDIVCARDQYKQNGRTGFGAYAHAAAKTILGDYKRTDITVTIDNEIIEVKKAVSIIVTKIPYYGYGLNVVPKAKLDDGNLHVMSINSGFAGILFALATSFLGGNKTGVYRTSTTVKIVSDEHMRLQIQGTLQEQAKEFSFKVLAGLLKMRY